MKLELLKKRSFFTRSHFVQDLSLSYDFFQALNKGVSDTLSGWIFGISPFVIFLISPFIGKLVSTNCKNNSE